MCYVSKLDDIEDYATWIEQDDHYFYQWSFSSATEKWQVIRSLKC